MQLILVDPNTELGVAWRRHFADLPDVEIVNAGFERLPAFDCLVSPGNAFGLMDGGVDLAIARFFGPALVDRVQQEILNRFKGEQPVGTSFVVRARDPDVVSSKGNWLAHTPTMRVPLPIAGTDAVYRAMSALLLAVERHNTDVVDPGDRITTVACPGLGTGYGRVSPDQAAAQMALAYRYFLNPPTRLDWAVAKERQRAVEATLRL
jgi:O-acetyl-ADP-ribose deacetylase (regulator of RNase III)